AVSHDDGGTVRSPRALERHESLAESARPNAPRDRGPRGPLRDLHLQPLDRAGDGARPRDLCLRPLDAEALGAPALDRVRLLGPDQPGALLVPADQPGYPARLGHSRLPRDRARGLDRGGGLPRIPAQPLSARIAGLFAERAPPARLRTHEQRRPRTIVMLRRTSGSSEGAG